jgi:hypothetical protein
VLRSELRSGIVCVLRRSLRGERSARRRPLVSQGESSRYRLRYGKETWERAPTKRHGHRKRWRASCVDDDGSQKAQVFDTKLEAQKWLEGYGVHRKAAVHSAKTHIAKIKQAFGPKSLNEVRPSAVKAWLADLGKQELADSYRHALHSRLSQILGDAVYDGVLVRHPCSHRNAPPMGKPKCYMATTDQVRCLYEALPRWGKTAVLLGAFAGIRAGQAFSGAFRADMDFYGFSSSACSNPIRQWPDKPLKTETIAMPCRFRRSLSCCCP